MLSSISGYYCCCSLFSFSSSSSPPPPRLQYGTNIQSKTCSYAPSGCLRTYIHVVRAARIVHVCIEDADAAAADCIVEWAASIAARAALANDPRPKEMRKKEMTDGSTLYRALRIECTFLLSLILSTDDHYLTDIWRITFTVRDIWNSPCSSRPLQIDIWHITFTVRYIWNSSAAPGIRSYVIMSFSGRGSF